MAVQILSARPEHSDGIGYVHYTAWEQTYRGLMPDGFLNGRTLEKCRALSRAYPGPRLVAVDGGQVVGFACYEHEARDFTNRTGMSEVSALYLLRSHQGQGNGRRLMEACLAALPHAQVILYVLKGNKQAIGFYGHMGFCLTGRELRQDTGFGEIVELEMLLTRVKKNAPHKRGIQFVQAILPLGPDIGLGGQRALHIAAAQATGANIQTLRLTIDHNANALYVRRPNAIGLAVRVAYIVAAHRALRTNLTKLAHNYTS